MVKFYFSAIDLIMQPAIRISILIIILYNAISTNIQASAEEVVLLRLSDKKVIGFKEMIRDIKGCRLIFVGESHDKELHHRLQLDIVKELNDSKVPVTVGLEMFMEKSQKNLDRWVAGELSIDDFAEVYYRNWNVAWTHYNDILLYLRDHRIPTLGLNLPKEIIQKVNKKGFSSLTGRELEDFPPGITCTVDKRYMEFISQVYRAHGNADKQFVNFCETLVLRDKAMAQHLAEYIKKNPDRTVVVFTGSTHAWKKGIPEQIKAILKGISFKVIIPGMSGYIEPRRVNVDDTDYLLMESRSREKGLK